MTIVSFFIVYFLILAGLPLSLRHSFILFYFLICFILCFYTNVVIKMIFPFLDVGFMDSIEEFTIDANKQLEFLPGSLLLSSGLKYLGVNGYNH